MERAEPYSLGKEIFVAGGQPVKSAVAEEVAV